MAYDDIKVYINTFANDTLIAQARSLAHLGLMPDASSFANNRFW
jgi:hypothetical protein